MRCARWVFLALTFCVHQVIAAECEGRDDMSYVCGVQGMEDLVAVPETPWLVGGGLASEREPGSLSLVHREQKSVVRLFPDAAVANRHDPRTYPGCAEPVSRAVFSAHGINLRRGER